MVIPVQQAEIAIMEYLEKEIARKFSGVTKFATYFLIEAMQGKVPRLISKLYDNLFVEVLDVFTEEGHIRLDDIYSWTKKAMEKCGAVTMSGITFNSQDVDKLYETMKAKAMY